MIKKIILCLFAMCPFVSVAETDLLLRDQMLDSEILRLTKERDEKYAALKQCEKNTKGFKIAGITTLIATGVGVGVDVKLAQDLDKVTAAADTAAAADQQTSQTAGNTITNQTASGATVTNTTTSCNLASVVDIEASDHGYYELDGDKRNVSKYGLTQKGQWATEFPWGIVKGTAMCSNTPGTYTNVGNPDRSPTPASNRYCWCKMDNNYTMNGENCSEASPSWMFFSDYDSVYDCAGFCAYNCAYRTQHDSDFRAAVFGVKQ